MVSFDVELRHYHHARPSWVIPSKPIYFNSHMIGGAKCVCVSVWWGEREMGVLS